MTAVDSATAARVRLPSEQIAAFCERWNVVEIALFGSVLRDDFGPDSDVDDVLVQFRPGQYPSLFGLSEMESDLAEMVGRRVDLVERRGVEQSPNYIRRRAILNSARTIYAV